MIMRLGANSHFAVRLPPGLTSQCISSIMQRHWDPFRCAPLRAWYTPSAQRRGCGHSSSQGRLAGWLACLRSSQGTALRLPRTPGSCGVIVSRSPPVTLTGSAAARGNHGQNTDRMREGSVQGEVGLGSGTRGRSGAHEPGAVGVRTARYPGNIYTHTVDVASELVRKTSRRIFNR